MFIFLVFMSGFLIFMYPFATKWLHEYDSEKVVESFFEQFPHNQQIDTDGEIAGKNEADRDEHNDKGGGYCNDRGFCFCGNKHGQSSQEEVSDVAADQGQHPSLPEGDVIQRFPDSQLNHAIATFEAKVTQCGEAVDQHSSPIENCDQQKSCLDFCRSGFVSS